MKIIIYLVLIFISNLSFSQTQEFTKWIERGSLENEESTIYVASKYILPTGILKHDSSFYYEGEFVILTSENFDSEEINNGKYLDLFYIEDEKCLNEDFVNITDLTNEFNHLKESRIFLLPLHICSDYILGFIFEVSNKRIKKLLLLKMWANCDIEFEQIDKLIYSMKYHNDEGIENVLFDFDSKKIVSK